MTFNVLVILLLKSYHFNWQIQQAADSLRNVIETKLDIMGQSGALRLFTKVRPLLHQAVGTLEYFFRNS